ncbi:hypothetical protein, partial [Paenibacillus elgii]|uniref:hypothetical protein n=1 Tax=Paenibacillus elgii TaxID=189691 RepID=UPI0019537D21
GSLITKKAKSHGAAASRFRLNWGIFCLLNATATYSHQLNLVKTCADHLCMTSPVRAKPYRSAYTVTIFGGSDTDPQDHNRPEVIIASILGVPTEVLIMTKSF